MKLTPKRLLLSAASLSFFLVPSCASQKVVPISDVRILQNKRIATIQREKPDFTAETPGPAALRFAGIPGRIGAEQIMNATGNQIVRDNSVEDPAVRVSKELAETLRNKCFVSLATPIKTNETDPEEIAKLASRADYVVDVQTEYWGLGYFSRGSDQYHVTVYSRFNLIDCKTGKVIASGEFSRESQKNDPSFTYDGLIKNQAKGLKQELRVIENDSLFLYRSGVLKL